MRLNNGGVGHEGGRRGFYQHLLSTTSTFCHINRESEWVKVKCRLLNVAPDELVRRGYEVPVVKLDDYARENTIERIAILKIDAEGSEPACLVGSETTLCDGRLDITQVEAN